MTETEENTKMCIYKKQSAIIRTIMYSIEQVTDYTYIAQSYGKGNIQ